MITRAIVEEIITPYHVRVRIPTLDRLSSAPMSANTKDLNVATFCSLPNCYTNVQVGDVVFIGFEDNTYHKAVILGHLSREAMADTYSDVTFGNLVVKGSAMLPAYTTIGIVTPEEIAKLQGTRDNLQKQIDSLKQEVETLGTIITELRNKGGNA